ncbi:MAG: flagellar biosynthetic protein FliQ [Planctomycetota bacterium]|nr:flagellar biosynthetic protein FliQ [Planctomycetota bacterium]MCZ6445217.1 flagellar biosynthetic protein FliQ [Planctomycetota bacterium]MCZ6492788.1 flagellar biosynthetic protein FliQ [Planctomycetota bacterium]MCZ6542484.1 flagellar biosynthetic protein FliQ [Planctomycetota bacterium]MCZ6611335.1 flagellar biosynthetic protein FliQ [Planctomycetota bacterium]
MLQDPVDVARIALMQALIIAVPILGAGLVVGLLISLFQAVTQIQEQTLTFVPKIIVMILVAVVLLSWISIRMANFAVEMFTDL